MSSPSSSRRIPSEGAPDSPLESGVRLLPPTDTTPLRSKMPLERAQRWRSPFEQNEDPLVSVFMTSNAFVRCCAHAGSDPDHEVGGGLVGEWHEDERLGSFVLVDGIIPARHTRQGSAFLTFTQDTLVAMNEELEDRYPNRQLVGWFHTHPRMGVFLSSYDVWLHQHFFPEPWQVALVIEPHSAIGGFFVRQKSGFLDVHQYFGFYELRDEDTPSVVHWKNLTLVEQAGSSGGEDD